jgi:hypothetical protein
MTEIVLNGLEGSNPIGALASFGLLRMSSRINEMKGTRLGWKIRNGRDSPTDEALAVLDVPDPINEEKLIELIYNSVQGHYDENIFGWDKRGDKKTNSKNFKSRIEELNENASSDEREEIDYFSAYGSEVATDEDGNIKKTLFYMISGQQTFFITTRKIYDVVAKKREKISEALFGPWKYEDDVHSLGWDPQTTRLHAYRNTDPSPENLQSNAGVIWLALQALPLFPSVPYQSSRSKGAILKTTGFKRDGGNDTFLWPIWEGFVGIDTLKTLLSSQELANGANSREALEGRGVVSVYKCVRLEGEKGRVFFSWRFFFSSPEVVWVR